MKEYVLKIGFNPLTDEVLYIKEYIDGAKAILHIDDVDIELDDEITKYISSEEIGID